MQNSFRVLMSLLCLSVLAGCGAKKKELTQVEQLQINNFYETARRQIFIKNYVAAEDALVSVTKIDETNFATWLDIGVLRMRLEKKSTARDAYKKALSLSEDAFSKDANNQGALVTRLQALVCLNRATDARDVITKAAKDNPTNATYQQFLKQNIVDAFLADPQIKESIVQ